MDWQGRQDGPTHGTDWHGRQGATGFGLERQDLAKQDWQGADCNGITRQE
jgi:hypothetical protein